jgi:hypothetical protein
VACDRSNAHAGLSAGKYWIQAGLGLAHGTKGKLRHPTRWLWHRAPGAADVRVL